MVDRAKDACCILAFVDHCDIGDDVFHRSFVVSDNSAGPGLCDFNCPLEGEILDGSCHSSEEAVDSCHALIGESGDRISVSVEGSFKRNIISVLIFHIGANRSPVALLFDEGG